MSDTPKNILVTGSSAGFGDLIVRRLARDGHRVFATMRDINGRNAEAAQTLLDWAAAEGLRVEVVELDIADERSTAAAVETILAAAGQIDVVINNAGISARGPLESFTPDQIRNIYEINVFGPLRLNAAVLPGMRARRNGLIVHVSSTLGRVLPRAGGLYPATKWAVEGLAESQAYELKPFGIDLVIMEPGAFPTSAVVRGMRAEREDIVAAYVEANGGPRPPRSRPGPDYQPPDPNEMAIAVSEIVAMPAGQRPLRRVVGPIFTEGVADYNAAYEAMRDNMQVVLQRPDQAVTWT